VHPYKLKANWRILLYPQASSWTATHTRKLPKLWREDRITLFLESCLPNSEAVDLPQHPPDDMILFFCCKMRKNLCMMMTCALMTESIVQLWHFHHHCQYNRICKMRWIGYETFQQHIVLFLKSCIAEVCELNLISTFYTQLLRTWSQLVFSFTHPLWVCQHAWFK